MTHEHRNGLQKDNKSKTVKARALMQVYLSKSTTARALMQVYISKSTIAGLLKQEHKCQSTTAALLTHTWERLSSQDAPRISRRLKFFQDAAHPIPSSAYLWQRLGLPSLHRRCIRLAGPLRFPAQTQQRVRDRAVGIFQLAPQGVGSFGLPLPPPGLERCKGRRGRENDSAV